MPTYEYKREDGSTFEVIQTMSEDPLKTCPTTGQPVKRLISGGTGLVFKGDGFYTTDYKKKESSNGSSGDTSSKKGSDNTDSSDA